MARTRLYGSIKESNFRELPTKDLIINLWNLNYFKYHRLKDRWREEWGQVNYVLKQIKNCNKQFIDLDY